MGEPRGSDVRNALADRRRLSALLGVPPDVRGAVEAGKSPAALGHE
jgi:hypothetical protein